MTGNFHCYSKFKGIGKEYRRMEERNKRTKGIKEGHKGDKA
jgi:hypothetical protein